MAVAENSAAELNELFGPANAMLFKEEEMSPIFCKPKLIPLKTVTTEKLEKMQKEAIEKLKALEEPQVAPAMTIQTGPIDDQTTAEGKEEESVEGEETQTADNEETKQLDIWSAE